MSLPRASNGRDAAIHRASEERDWQSGSFPDSQWIATPFRLAMTRRNQGTGQIQTHELLIARLGG